MAKVIKAKGDAGNIPDVERAPVGLFIGKATKLEQTVSNNSGKDQVQVIWNITAGVDNGKRVKLKDKKGRAVQYESIFYYAPLDITEDDISPMWARRLKDLLTAFKLPMKGANLMKIEGKEALLRLREGTDAVGDYRPDISKVLPLSSLEDLEDEEPEDDEEPDEEPDDEAGEDEEEDYTEDELKELSTADLRGVAEELEIEDIPGRITSKSKPKLIAAILEAQGGEVEEEEEEEEDDEEDDGLDEMDRKELKAYISENDLEVKVLKRMSEDDIRDAIREAEGEDEEEEEDEEDEDETEDNYDELEVADLKQECEDRELSSKGKKDVLIARLRKDDKENPV